MDSEKILLGDSQDLQLYHDGSNSYINNTTGILRIRDSEIRLCNTDNETYFMGAANGAAKLYYDDTVKLETASNGIQLLDELGINDNKAAMFGDSDDMKIYHDGSHSYINNVTNTLYIRSADTYIQDETGDETNAKFINNAAVELYYDNSKKLETTSYGAKITSTTATLVLESTSNGNSPVITFDSNVGGDQQGSITYTHLNSCLLYTSPSPRD